MGSGNSITTKKRLTSAVVIIGTCSEFLKGHIKFVGGTYRVGGAFEEVICICVIE